MLLHLMISVIASLNGIHFDAWIKYLWFHGFLCEAGFIQENDHLALGLG